MNWFPAHNGSFRVKKNGDSILTYQTFTGSSVKHQTSKINNMLVNPMLQQSINIKIISIGNMLLSVIWI